MVTVYRVQDDKGIGPYMSELSYQSAKVSEILSDHSYDNGRPNPRHFGEPWEDIAGHNQHEVADHIFGFLLKADLEKWFEDCLDYLLELGFEVVEMQISPDNIRLGNSGQISFPKPY